MRDGLVVSPSEGCDLANLGQGESLLVLPRLIGEGGERAKERYLEFFLAHIRNKNTRAAYGFATARFLSWCEEKGLTLETISPIAVAAYVENFAGSPASTKQHLAAIRRLFDHLVTGGVLGKNPAASVKGPRHVVRKGKTPVLSAEETRQILDTIDTRGIVGLRDRAIIAVMTFSFARVGAVCRMKVGDYYRIGRRSWLRLHEKGGRFHEVPAHHRIEEYVDAYLERAETLGDRGAPLFQRSVGRTGRLTGEPLSRLAALKMVKRRAREAGLEPELVRNHSFRATGITAYLKGGGTLEKAAQIAGHASTVTTKLYDRRVDELTLDEIERIVI